MDVDDTLVLILQRIDSPVSLIRAASTCRRWHRIIADVGFLRRFRSLHGALSAGDYNNGYPITDPRDHNKVVGHRPVFVPSCSIKAHRFSLDFLESIYVPDDSRWYKPSWVIKESRGSLLLIEYTHPDREYPHHEIHHSFIFPDIVVCEPLTQRYKIIPPPPHFSFGKVLGPFLIDGDEDESGGCIGMSNFRVLCVLINHSNVVAHTTVFTVGDSMNDSKWSEKKIDHIASRIVDPYVTSWYLGRVFDVSYFYIQQDGTLITRDGSTGEFSSSVLSLDVKLYWDDHTCTLNSSVVDGGDGEPRIVTITHNTLVVIAMVGGQWRVQNKILLSKVTRGLLGRRPSFFEKLFTITRSGVGFIVISPLGQNSGASSPLTS